MSEMGYLHNAKNQANRARNEARPEVIAYLKSILLHKGIIFSVEEGGGYGVGIYNDAGVPSWWFTGAQPFPLATYAIEAEIWMTFEQSAEIPTIIAGAGGSGGECSTCLKNYGMLTE